MSKAVGYSEYGGPEVLEIIDVPEPHAGQGEVRVAVRAAGLNPFDYKVRRGGYLPNHQLPSLQGAEFSGVIDEVGPAVDDTDAPGWAVGDEVLGWIGRGAQAEYVVVPHTHVAAKPPALDWSVAAAIGLVANTAKRAVDSLALGPGEFLVAGIDVQITFTPCPPGAPIAGIADAEAGTVADGRWQPGRKMSGDDILLNYHLAEQAAANQSGSGLRFGPDGPTLQRVKLYRYR